MPHSIIPSLAFEALGYRGPLNRDQIAIIVENPRLNNSLNIDRYRIPINRVPQVSSRGTINGHCYQLPIELEIMI